MSNTDTGSATPHRERFAAPCRTSNPYEAFVEQSRYFSVEGNTLVAARHDSACETDWEHLHHVFRATVLSPFYPCVGAKAAVRADTYRMGFYGSIAEVGMGLAHDLFEFAGEQPSMGGFATFVAAFDALPFPSSIDDFHAQLFGQLQHLAEVDEFDWDPTVSSDPRSSEFEFSFAGRAWFVVGFTPNSPRVARRFLSPLLIFNAHEQFEQLRADGKYTGMQKSIRRRDQRLQPGGQPNPMLADTGESPAWRQFSGQMLPEDAQCPFETRREQQ